MSKVEIENIQLKNRTFTCTNDKIDELKTLLTILKEKVTSARTFNPSLPEAPIDGNQYVRQNKQWVKV